MNKDKTMWESIARRILSEDRQTGVAVPITDASGVVWISDGTYLGSKYEYKNPSGVKKTFSDADLKAAQDAAAAAAKPANTPAAGAPPQAQAPQQPAPPTTPRTATDTGEKGYKKLNNTVNSIANHVGVESLKSGKENFEYGISRSARINVDKVNFSKSVDDPDANFVAALILVCESITPQASAKATAQASIIDRIKTGITDFFKPDSKDIKVSGIFSQTDWDAMIEALKNLQNDASPKNIKPILTDYLRKIDPGGDVILTSKRSTPDDFANYLAVLYESTLTPEQDAGILSGVAGAVTGAVAGVADAVTGAVPGTDATPTPAPAPSEPKAILKFLSDKVDLYFDKVSGFADKQALVKAINEGNKFGPSAGKALDALIDAIQEKAGKNNLKPYEGYPGTPNKLDSIKSSKSEADLSRWGGAGDTFPAGTQGLIDFLRFSYAAASGPNAEGVKEAAAKMGIIENNQFFPVDKLWQELCFSGALSPFPFFVILGPENDRVPRDAKIYIETTVTSGPVPTSAQDVPRTFIKVKDFVRDYPRGVVLCVGREDSNRTEVAGYMISPDIFGDDAKRFIDARGRQVRIVMEIDKQAYVVVVNLKFGEVVDFKALARKPAPQQQSGAALAREVSKMVSVAGRTVGGKTNPFTFENVYIKNDGTLSMRTEDVTLQKRVPIGGGDEFELRVTNPEYNYILVPVRLETAAGPARLSESRGLISEQTEGAAHWVVNYSRSRQQVAPGPSGAAVGFLPVTSISWKTNRNQRLYGPGGINITRVDYTPANISRDRLPDDVNIITPEQAMRLGQRSGGLNPIEYAISTYVASNENPLGTPLYLAMSINRQINNEFPPATVAAGGYN